MKRFPRLTMVILIICVHWSIIQCISLPRPPDKGQQTISSIIRTELQISNKNSKIFSCCTMHKKNQTIIYHSQGNFIYNLDFLWEDFDPSYVRKQVKNKLHIPLLIHLLAQTDNRALTLISYNFGDEQLTIVLQGLYYM